MRSLTIDTAPRWNSSLATQVPFSQADHLPRLERQRLVVVVGGDFGQVACAPANSAVASAACPEKNSISPSRLRRQARRLASPPPWGSRPRRRATLGARRDARTRPRRRSTPRSARRSTPPAQAPPTTAGGPPARAPCPAAPWRGRTPRGRGRRPARPRPARVGDQPPSRAGTPTPVPWRPRRASPAGAAASWTAPTPSSRTRRRSARARPPRPACRRPAAWRRPPRRGTHADHDRVEAVSHRGPLLGRRHGWRVPRPPRARTAGV